MAEGYESYHVPQQSRRDKLRVGGCVVDSAPNLHGLFHHPLYDPSLIPSDFLNHGYAVKSEGISLMGYVSSSSSAATSRHHHYLDPHSNLPILNPNSIQDMNSGANNPFPYNLRDFDQSSYNGANEVVVYQPEPLSLTHHDSNNTGCGGGGGGGQGLSLSLSSHHNNLPLELNLQRYDGGGYVVPAIVGGGGGSASTSNDVSRSSVPLGPFTGYASILKGSRFLKPAQQLLEEFCDVGRGIYAEKFAVDSSFMDQQPPLESFSSGGVDDGGENRRKKSRLISMLDEVYRRYKQYYQQMQSVMASFEYVAGLGNAAPYANLALKTMSKHFKCLKNAITDQLQSTNKAHGQISHGKDEAGRFENADRGFYSQRPVNNSGYPENQSVWRPQRGLPERAVTVLRAWLFEHFLHPYPTDTDKIMLAKQTGLSRSQVSNWFINARVRLWKPMVEEIHMLETRQAHKGGLPREDRIGNRPNDHLNSANAVTLENPNTSQRLQDTPSKRSRNELADVLVRNDEPQNLSYNNLSSGHTQGGVGVGGSGSGSVSLTLGLHQNNGIGLPESFPINAAQRFGLGMEGNNEGYVMSGFEAQNRHFGRDVGGQLLHDFVG